MKRILLAGLAMIASMTAAGAADCSKAATPIEKMICGDDQPEITWRDEQLNTLYTNLKEAGQTPKLGSEQAAWLRKRDACGADVSCITKRYEERLVELAFLAGDTQRVSGRYAYRYPVKAEEGLEARTDTGDAFILHLPDDLLAGQINSVTGPTFHICDISFDNAEPFEDAWVWVASADDADSEGKQCTILFRPGKNSLKINSQNCMSNCGARGNFDDTYKRVK